MTGALSTIGRHIGGLRVLNIGALGRDRSPDSERPRKGHHRCRTHGLSTLLTALNGRGVK